MERREAIISITSVLGYTITPASVISLSNACSGASDTLSWSPSFYSVQDALIIENLGEAFLPTTETPGSIDVGAHLFVDAFLVEVATLSDQEKHKKGLDIWKQDYQEKFGSSPAKSSIQELQEALSSYFEIEQSRQQQIKAMLDQKKPDQSNESDYYIYSFLMTFKRLIMLGYYASEEIGENVLSYLPVPGKYEGCMPAEEVGYSWSL